MRALTVAFPGVGTVLDGVDLALAPGRCLAVVGESGAGKSVLARTLVGLAGAGGARARVRAEQLSVAGSDMRRASPARWRKLRGSTVGFVLQDALQSLDPLRRIGAEVGEALHVRGVPRPERARRAMAALARAGLPDPQVQMRRRSGELSGGMRQRVLIASAIITDPPLLIVDEPTTALDATVGLEVLRVLGQLRDAGTAVLLITHDLGAASRLADDIAVLEAGRVVEHGPASRVLDRPTHPVTRRLLDSVPRGPRTGAEGSRAAARPAAPSPAPPRPAAPSPAPPVLTATGLRREYRLPTGEPLAAVAGVDLSVHAGEVLGIVGESGSGKTTLARLLLGAERPDAGAVNAEGRMRVVPQDPLASFDPRLRAGRILRHAIAAGGTSHTVAQLLAQVQLAPSVAQRYPRALSGGMRQRLAIARALAADPELLILDEPVSALDVTVQAAILQLLARIQQERGMAMIFISHDLAVVRQVSTSVAVMAGGKIIERAPTEQLWAAPQHPLTAQLLAAATFAVPRPRRAQLLQG